MATPLPAAGGCDTSDMVMIHRHFRKLYADAIVMVTRVADGDVPQAGLVAGHLDNIVQDLHGHHHGEDELLWDQLAARAPACAVHVEQMKQQHASMSALLDELVATLPAWRETADAASRARVVVALEAAETSLRAHLGQEEEQILPVAAQSFPQAEWSKLGEHGRASVPRNRQLVNLGYILDSMTPEDAHAFLKQNLPAPVRLLYRLFGKPKFEAERKALLGA